MPQLPNVNRARIVMDLIKDAEVATLANYADTAVDYLDGATAIKYVDAMLMNYGGQNTESLAGMDNEEKAVRYMDVMKAIHRRALAATTVRDSVDAFRVAEKAAAEAIGVSDLGADEYVAPVEEPTP